MSESVEEILEGMGSDIGKVIADRMGVIFKVYANRGVCAGSLNYRHQPGHECDEWEVWQVALAAYRQRGAEPDFATPEGFATFWTTFLDSAKYLVQHGSSVRIVGRLLFMAHAYKNGRDAWMKPIAPNHAFNVLSTPVELDKPKRKICAMRKAAMEHPYNDAATQAAAEEETVSTQTYVTCTQCGNPFKIADGLRR